ncbi:MAG: TonB-dependent receptor [Kofleriaceae bacterium]
MKKFVIAALMIGASAHAQPAPDQPPPPPEEKPPEEKPPEEKPPEPAPAQEIEVTGRVIDKLGKPIRGAKVSYQGTTKTVTTDRGGRFKITAPIGVTLTVEKDAMEVGLANVTGPVIDEIVLLELDATGEKIEVQGQAPVDAPGAAVIDRQELQRVPGTGGDVVKALSAMPGVVNQQLPLGYSGVVIRGSSPQDSKVLVDDFEIPVLFHNIGFRAILPAESIETLEYIPGGFDVGYGRASSGIIQLTTRPGDDKATEQAEVSVIDGGLLVQGKSGKTRYMFGFRRSLIDLILPYIIPSSVDLSLTTVPSYYDEQFRIDHQLNNKWNLTLSSVGTIDSFELYATKDTDAKSKRFFNRTAFARLTAAAKYHDGPWSANLALSGILPEFIFELGEFQKIDVVQPAVTPRAEIVHYDKTALGLTNVEWRVGVEAQISKSYLTLALPHEQREGENQEAYDPRDVTESFHGNFWLPDYAQWASVAANLDPRIRVTLGMRLDEAQRNEDLAIQPRGKIEVKLWPKVTARFTAGAYRRPPEYQSEVLQNNLDYERSTQMIAGLGWEPDEGTRLQTSVYYTDRSHLIVTEADGSLGNDGRGRTVGAELLGTYRHGPWFGWLSYSYSHSTRVDHPGDPERLFSYDQPHSLNAALSWKHGKWQLGGRFQLYSGLPYTPVKGAIYDSDRNLYIPIYDETNSARAPIHHQLDIRIDRSFKLGAAQMTYFLDVQNVYLNDSVVTYFYGYDYSQQTAFKSLPIIPSVGLRGVL